MMKSDPTPADLLHRLGEHGEPPTKTEIALLGRPPQDDGAHADRLHGVASRFAELLVSEGHSDFHAHRLATHAVIEFLDEFGGQRVRFPERLLFFQHLLRPMLPELVRLLRGRMRMADMAHRLGVCRRTLERAVRHQDRALSQPDQRESRNER